jgi:hypothetical protein
MSGEEFSSQMKTVNFSITEVGVHERTQTQRVSSESNKQIIQPTIPALKRLRQDDRKFEGRLGH